MLKKNSRQKKTHNKNSTHSKLKFKISIYFFQKKGCKVLNLSLSFILFYILIRDTLLKIVVKWVKMFMYGSILIFFGLLVKPQTYSTIWQNHFQGFLLSLLKSALFVKPLVLPWGLSLFPAPFQNTFFWKFWTHFI